jgi:hypothetical protein
MTNHKCRLRLFAYIAPFVILSLIAVSAVSSAAQSGRRARKPAVVTPPVPEPSPEEKKAPQETKPALTFIIGSDRQENFSVPMHFTSSVVRACADRLDDAPSVRVDLVHRDMHRGEAVKRAKQEKEAYVVLIELRTEFASSSRDSSELYIQYSVFAPVTGKSITSGRTYQQAYRTGPVIAGPRTTGRTNAPYTEILLQRAAREAAERILSAMKDATPGFPVPG